MNNEEAYKKYLLKCFDNIKKTRKVLIESNGTHAKIQCFNLQHKGGMESDPSFRVNLVKNGKFRAGSGKCFTCGMMLGSWNKVLEGIKRPDLLISESQFEEDEYITVKDKKSLTENLLGDDDEESGFMRNKDAIPWPSYREWRGIKGGLVTEIGGKLYFDEEIETQMLYLPCNVNGQEVGGIRANIEKRSKNNYFNTRGSWTKSTGLFPYDYTLKVLVETGVRTLLLGEGPRDSLNPLQKGIPALSILGSENWSDIKAELILSLPIDRLILAFDPDEAGERATKSVYKALKDDISIRRFKFDKYGEAVDPGNMPSKATKKIREFVIGDW